MDNITTSSNPIKDHEVGKTPESQNGHPNVENLYSSKIKTVENIISSPQ